MFFCFWTMVPFSCQKKERGRESKGERERYMRGFNASLRLEDNLVGLIGLIPNRKWFMNCNSADTDKGSSEAGRGTDSRGNPCSEHDANHLFFALSPFTLSRGFVPEERLTRKRQRNWTLRGLGEHRAWTFTVQQGSAAVWLLYFEPLSHWTQMLLSGDFWQQLLLQETDHSGAGPVII